jgi:predicted NUDIX family NTP pyrophosphohydrolase
MPKQSAGILAYRKTAGQLEFFLVHPGGPFWKNKDEGAWSIPKGEFTTEEDPLTAARREFHEETGTPIDGDFIPLGSIQQRSGKIVHAWLVEFDIDASAILSNTFSIEWPPKSGKLQEFPEVDRAEWFGIVAAARKINPAQHDLLLQAAKLIQPPN